MNGRILIPGKPVPASEIPDYTIARDTLDEILSDAFRQRLRRLNTIITHSGERLEGNVFYADRDEAFAERLPAPDLAPARRNLWRAARFSDLGAIARSLALERPRKHHLNLNTVQNLVRLQKPET